MPLSDAKIRALKTTDRDYKVADFDGLYLLVKKSGGRSWRFKYRVAGKEKLMVFGDYPHVSLLKARSLRDEAKGKLIEGVDPAAEKQRQRRAETAAPKETFGYLADAYLDKVRAEQKAEATITKAVWLLEMAKADFGEMPIREVTATVILTSLRKREARENYETAKRLRSKIGAVFRFAVASGLAEMDPTYALKDALIRPTSKPRAAILDPVRLGDLMRAIDASKSSEMTRIALRLLAITAQRPGNVRQARWEEFDCQKAVWMIPALRMKMRRPHQVPLPSQALALLERLHPLTGNSGFLFPAQSSRPVAMSENTLNQAIRRMGFSGEEMTSHGFRASFATLANESGLWNPDAIERFLAHIDTNSVRKVYVRGAYWDERIRLAAWWADFLDQCRG